MQLWYIHVVINIHLSFIYFRDLWGGGGGGGALAQPIERSTPGEEVPGPISVVAARSLLVGSMSV